MTFNFRWINTEKSILFHEDLKILILPWLSTLSKQNDGCFNLTRMLTSQLANYALSTDLPTLPLAIFLSCG